MLEQLDHAIQSFILDFDGQGGKPGQGISSIGFAHNVFLSLISGYII
jgi:hypothetical protein